ncbi:MAG: response regulator transcription factor [Acidobacteriota bacterium]|nr:response regulator transcription factor [Acidobacteriota bacterium]
MTQETDKKTIVICDMQPVTSEGLRFVLNADPGLTFAGSLDSLDLAMLAARTQHPDIFLIDKGFGMQTVLDWIPALKLPGSPYPTPSVVVWGVSMTEAEALRLLQAGARGIVRKTAGIAVILDCLRAVGAGRSWMEDRISRDSFHNGRHARSSLTAREQQVLGLVEQGFKNKEIARELGIRPGTVKIHLKHVFEKTGVRGRYGLALTGLREKGLVSIAS